MSHSQVHPITSSVEEGNIDFLSKFVDVAEHWVVGEQHLVKNLGEGVLARAWQHADLVQILRETGHLGLSPSLGHVPGVLLDEEGAQEPAKTSQQAEGSEITLHHQTFVELEFDPALGALFVPPVFDCLHAFHSLHDAVGREEAEFLYVSVVSETPSSADEAAEAVSYEDDVRELELLSPMFHTIDEEVLRLLWCVGHEGRSCTPPHA